MAAAALAALAAMVAITAATGVSQETFEIYRAPDVYAADLRDHALALRALFGIDSAFLVLYTALLVGVANALATPATRTLLGVAIAATVVTALLDMVEDHHILAMLRAAETGQPPTAGELVFQHAASQVKFNASYLGLFVLGLHVPRDALAGRALAWLLTAGTLVQSAWLYAAPDAMLPVGNLGRWLGFVAGFALIIALARRPRAPSRLAAGVA